MKVALFKIKASYATTPSARAVLFHGDVAWFVNYSAKTFAREAGLSVEPVVNILNAKDFFSGAQQATFFSHERNTKKTCLISGMEVGTMTTVRPILAEIPSEVTVVMISHAYLRPSSGVRRYFEKEDDCFIVPVFTPSSYQVNQYIQNFFQTKGVQADRDAVAFLAQHMMHFVDQMNNILEIVVLYHGSGCVNVDGVRQCLNAARMQPNTMRVVLAFFLGKKEEFFDGIKIFDLQDTAELLFFLRLLQDAALAILLSKESLLSPSDARALKWQALIGSHRMWDRANIARILAWIMRAEVSAKRQEFFKDVGFLFQFFVVKTI